MNMEVSSVLWLIAFLLFGPTAWRLGTTFFKAIAPRLSFRRPLRCLPGPKSRSLITGNLTQIFDQKNGFEFIENMVDEFGGAVLTKGLFGADHVFISDPSALQKLVLNDEGVFEETDITISVNSVVFGPGIFSVLGTNHKKQRKMLTPAFTAGHLKAITPIFYEIVHKLRDAVEQSVLAGNEEINIMPFLSTTALELIGQGGLGHSFGAFTEKQGEYAKSVTELLPAVFRIGIFLPLMPYITSLGSPAFRRYLAEYCPIPAVKQIRDIIDIMDNTSKSIISAKTEAIVNGEEALSGQIGKGRDVMSILMKANGESAKESRLNNEEVLAQMNCLIFAAYDSTSGALTRLIQQLSERQDVQTALRTEIRNALSKNGKAELDYDQINALPLLDAVCRETLRVHSPLTFMERTAKDDITLPLSHPIVSSDGKSSITQVPIPKGTRVFAGIAAANRSYSIWGADAREWKPERWMQPEGLPDSVTKARLPGAYPGTMTFWGGQRACLGFKFSQLEMKTVLLVLLDAFEFFPCPDKTINWYLATTRAPYVQGQEHRGPALPIKVRVP